MNLRTFLPYLAICIFCILIACDPEYEYKLTGKVITQHQSAPLTNIEITLFPVEHYENWRMNTFNVDSVYSTQENGMFEIQFNTLTLLFDSMRIDINKEGYLKHSIITTREDWNTGGRWGKNFTFDFGDILLKAKKR